MLADCTEYLNKRHTAFEKAHEKVFASWKEHLKGLNEQKDALDKSKANDEEKAKKIRKLNEASYNVQENNFAAVNRSLLVNVCPVKKEQKGTTSEAVQEEKKVTRPY